MELNAALGASQQNVAKHLGVLHTAVHRRSGGAAPSVVVAGPSRAKTTGFRIAHGTSSSSSPRSGPVAYTDVGPVLAWYKEVMSSHRRPLKLDLISQAPVIIEPDEPACAAAEILRAREVDHLLVAAPGSRSFEGVVTARDLLEACGP